jgi:hypothetical protein
LFRLGFLDGIEGLIFHFLQGFWFRFLVDSMIFEHRRSHRIPGPERTTHAPAPNAAPLTFDAGVAGAPTFYNSSRV